jgi:iron complex transport system ATP-binding protein
MGVILAAEGLGYAYPGRPRPVFGDVGLDISDGEILCVLGPNGIGKSTLLRCLAGLAPPSAGIVRVAGRPIVELGRAEIARQLALVPQSHQTVFAFPVRTVVEMGRAPHLGWFGSPGPEDAERAVEALRTLGIAHLADAPYTEISGGEQQLVQIARVLAQAPRLMILDEPTAHLDFANQARFLALVRRLARQGLGIIFTTHAPDHAYALADRTLVLSQHHPPLLGGTRAVLTAERLSETYGVPIRLIREGGHIACVAEVE